MEPASGTIESRWWYWILAYPIGLFLGAPLVALLAIFVGVPLVAFAADLQGDPSVAWLFIALVAGVIFIGLLFVLLAIFVMLPVALYFDAREIRDASIDWKPDPLVYALIAALQFLVTPLVGLIVSVYYLYRRHDAIGRP